MLLQKLAGEEQTCMNVHQSHNRKSSAVDALFHEPRKNVQSPALGAGRDPRHKDTVVVVAAQPSKRLQS